MANAVLDGVDGILLGAETLRGIYPKPAGLRRRTWPTRCWMAWTASCWGRKP